MGLLSYHDRIFVAGHRGLVGSAMVRMLTKLGYTNILTRTRQELDLRSDEAVKQFFQTEKPDVVFLAAAKVGGIHANNTYRADFIYENLQIQNNVIWNAHQSGVHRLVFFGSSCIYPRDCPQPIQESSLLSGKLESTNQPYAIAKIAGIELVSSLRCQYGRDYFCVMPTNLFGPNDNYHPENSHVLPALIRRICEAKNQGLTSVTVWGDGSPLREFMHADDLAHAVCALATKLSYEDLLNSSLGKQGLCHINVGTSQEISIKDLALAIKDLVQFPGQLNFDPTKPNGTPRKVMDSQFLRSCLQSWDLVKTRSFHQDLASCIQEFSQGQAVNLS